MVGTPPQQAVESYVLANHGAGSCSRFERKLTVRERTRDATVTTHTEGGQPPHPHAHHLEHLERGRGRRSTDSRWDGHRDAHPTLDNARQVGPRDVSS